MIGNNDPTSKIRGSRRGVLTILAIFVVGGIFVAGLYIASKRGLPEEYKSAQVGAPSRTLRFASMDLAYDRSRTHLVIDAIYKLKPDFVMVQRVTRQEAYELAQALEMRHGGTVQMFYSPNDPAAESQPGNAVLARWPLYQGRAMAKGHRRQFGIFVEAVVEGKRFLVGSWELADDAETARAEAALMVESWTRGGRLPLVVGGMDRGVEVPGLVEGEGIRMSEAWRVVESGVVEIVEMPGPLRWADVAGDRSLTRPASGAAE